MRGENREPGYPVGISPVETGADLPAATLLELDESTAGAEAPPTTNVAPETTHLSEPQTTPSVIEQGTETEQPEFELMAELKDVGAAEKLEAEIGKMMERTGSE